MIRIGSIVLWLGLIVTGLSGINLYTASPGQTDEPVLSWLTDSHIDADNDVVKLLAFTYPLCPFSRVTLQERSRLLPLTSQFQTTFVAVSNQEANLSWYGGLLNHAEQLSSVHVDQHRQRASRFGVFAYGHVLLFGAEGQCLFSGGLTVGRGDEGDGSSKLALGEALLECGISDRTVKNHSVIECSLQRSEEEG
ncbi:MAG: hypothetical protein VXZ82_20710 [Planctomycetota bacterium]|nr:hypothetical protein [Planctomycetota bacterium]